MHDSLLITKFYVPPMPPDWLSRPRLIEKLEAGLSRKLTLVSAPAGFGKTTLLTDWAHRNRNHNGSDHPSIAWVSLDSDDNDPVRFWTYFVAALRTVQSELETSVLSLLKSPKPPPIEAVLTTLINEIDRIGKPSVLVMDDYHVIEAHSIHQSVAFLIDHLPSHLRLIITTRADPPLPLSRLRGRGQLTEFRADDLRFTPDESTAFLNEVIGLNLAEDDIAILADRTEGWIASLQMAVISMQGRKDIPGFIRAFGGTHRYVVGYLLEEVLQRQSQDVQSFLLTTSILNRLSGPLCDAVTLLDDGQQKLEQLASSNLFLVPLDDEQRWFRYHQLFADLLRRELARTQPQLAVELHHRASEWYKQEGLSAEAIHHALAAKDYELAGDLIESAVDSMLNTGGGIATVAGWLVNLPADLLDSRPYLCLAQACVHFEAGRYNSVESCLETAEALMTYTGVQYPLGTANKDRTSGLIMALRATLACVRGDVAHTIQLCQEAQAYLPNEHLTARCLVAFNLGRAHWLNGEPVPATLQFADVIEQSKAWGNLHIAFLSMGYLADSEVKLGHLHRAAEICRDTIRFSTDLGAGSPMPGTSVVCIILSHILYQWNKLDEAVYYFVLGIESSKQNREYGAQVSLPGVEVLNRLQGQIDIFREIRNQLRGMFSNSFSVGNPDIGDAWLARMSLANGDLAAAERWLVSQSPALDLHSIPDVSREFVYLTLIRLCIARGDVGEIMGFLEELRRRAESQERTGSVIEILVIQSITLKIQSKPEEALITLERALSLAEPEGYLRIFIDEGEPVFSLLQDLASRKTVSRYVSTVLATMRSSYHRKTPSVGEPLGEFITERELEVLRLMADGMSNSEIAHQLVVEVSTVKSHVSHILKKLQVKGRIQAVDMARTLDLV